MKEKTNLLTDDDVQRELDTWRSNVISKILTITALVFSPAIVIWVIKFSSDQKAWGASVFYLLIYLTVVGLSVFRNLDARIKAWSLVLLCYATGTMAMILGGLVGDGRVYYMTVPILAFILIGTLAGILMAGICLFTYLGISIVAHTGGIADWLLMSDNSLSLSTWIQEGIIIAACLAMILALQKRHNKLLISLAREKVRLFGSAQESERRYRAISDLISDLAYAMRVNPDGSMECEWAVERGGWQRLVCPEDLPIAHEVNECLLSGEAAERELRIVTDDGDIRWVRNFARPEWDEDHDRVVRVFGAVQDITERKRAEAELHRRNEELSRLYRASEALISTDTPDPEHLAESIVEAVLDAFGKSNCSLLLIDERSDKPLLTRIAVTGPYTDEVRKGKLTCDGQGLVPKAIRTGRIINNPDVLNDPDYLPNWEAARSELAVPLKVGDKVIGVIDVQSAEQESFSEDDERLMSIFAERAALALENARLYKQTQERLRQISAFRNIDIAITGAVDLRLTLRILLREVTSQLGVDAADVLLYNPHLQTLEYAAGHGFHTTALQHTNLRLGEGNAGKAAMERRTIHVANVQEVEDGLKKAPLLPNEHFITYYGVPLLAKGGIKGVLEIFHRTQLNPGSDWLEFLEILAGQAAIAIDNATMFDGLQRSNIELIRAYDATLEGWVQALDMRDKETEDHTRRVTELTMKMAQSMNINGEKLIHVKRGALLHDIGKMSIPDSILLKPGKLTDDEWAIMHKHPIYAQRFLSEIDYLRPALEIPYSHHEKWDGTGYPQGLKAEQIPLAARIFAVVDVWDALSSDRPYREAWPQEKVIEYIQEQAGKQFDPQVVVVFFGFLETRQLEM